MRLTRSFVSACVVAAACTSAPARPPAHAVPASPWTAGEAPPLLAGIRLGDSLARVRAALGEPEGQRRLEGGALELEYWHRGLMVVTTADQGVALIGMVNPAAPVVAGVRVGDPVPYLVQAWGPWTRRAGARLGYVYGKWGVMVVADTSASPERVQSITFGWSAPNRSVQLPLVTVPDLLRSRP